MEAEVLLSGPRGRGFLLALADSQDVLQLAHRARVAAQPEGSTAAFGWAWSEVDPGASEEERQDRMRLAAEEARREMSRPVPRSELAATIRAAAPIARPDTATVIAALATTVDDARPWQSPDGIEALLASPEVLDVLRPIAELVAGAPWDAPLTQEQWSVVFAGQEDNVPPPPHEVLEWDKRPNDSWWSAPPHGLPRTTGALPGIPGIPAGLALVEDSMGASSALVTATAPPSDRVYEIASAADFARLATAYPRRATDTQREHWAQSTGRAGEWIVPDWPAVAQDWDGVHLTLAAYLEGATRPIDAGENRATFIAGWSPDATYWFVPAPASGPTTLWRRTDQLGWRPVR